MAYEENKTDRLRELSGSDFEIADHQPDIKGWEVFDASGDYIGDVEDLIFDTESLKVRYIITNLEDLENLSIGVHSSDDKKVLIPIGLLSLNESDNEVILTEALAANVGFLPIYARGEITPAQEVQIRDVLTGNLASNVTGEVYTQHPEGFYDHTHFDDKGYQRYQTGKDGLDKGEII